MRIQDVMSRGVVTVKTVDRVRGTHHVYDTNPFSDIIGIVLTAVWSFF